MQPSEFADDQPLSRQQASDAVSDLGWRHILGALQTCVTVPSPARSAELASRLLGEEGEGDAGDHLAIDLRPDHALLTLATRPGVVTGRDVALARRLSAVAAQLGLRMAAAGTHRSAQALEIAIDALDIPAVRPFWKAVLSYVDENPDAEAPNGLIDPLGQGPTLWFQQMDRPRPQRNRIHFDVSVPHDEAGTRIRDTLAAGGVLRSDAEAPAFWILADPEGNEACVCTWQGRD
ncbi:MAG TPA: VOC family protein [Pseudonocardiaceae bacterium]|nr:VOC family protein [Pseudonocardiaceae bacterium]